MTINRLLLTTAAISSVVACAAVFAADTTTAANATTATNSNVVRTPAIATSAKTKKHRQNTASVARTSSPAVSAAAVAHLYREVHALEAQINSLQQQQGNAQSSTSWNKLYAYGPAVATSPIIGVPKYDGSDLLVNLPSMNEDLAVLEQNQIINDYYAKNNLATPDRPILAFSGSLEGQIFSYSKFNADGKSDIDLTSTAIETVARVNPWITAMLRFEYDNLATPSYGSRSTGSTFKLKRGYAVVGDLNKFPLYLSFGQMYVPFGQYDNWMISEPITRTLARVEERPVVLGFSMGGVYASIYGFSGETKSQDSGRLAINQAGANLGYKYAGPGWGFNVGAGYIKNIADSLGLLNTGYTVGCHPFEGFKNHSNIRDQVPAADVHATFNFDPFTISAEYIATTTSFNSADATFNGHGAAPRAADLEGVYKFDVQGKPTFISAGFGESWESLIFNLPKYSYFVSVGTSFIKNTVQSIEFRHDVNYSKSDIATAACGHEFIKVGADTRDQIVGSFKVFF